MLDSVKVLVFVVFVFLDDNLVSYLVFGFVSVRLRLSLHSILSYFCPLSVFLLPLTVAVFPYLYLHFPPFARFGKGKSKG